MKNIEVMAKFTTKKKKKNYKLMQQKYDWYHLNNIINECLNQIFFFTCNMLVVRPIQ